jgi:shikimate dehydrogenase
MIKAGVIGHPIAHSRSPLIHGHWLYALGIKGSYERFDVPPEALGSFIAALGSNGLSGCNCTLPHKEAVLRLADRVLPAAEAIGAANTLWFEHGKLCADNTDAPGFLANLDEEAPGWDKTLNQIVIIGAGGAARGILYALLQRGAASVRIANRSIQRAASLAEEFGPRVTPLAMEDVAAALPRTDLLVNTTSLGMKGQPPLMLDLAGLPGHAVVSDIVYIPLATPLLAAAKARGLRFSGGLGMLLHQAVPGFERWFGERPSVTPELRRLIEADIGA